MKTVFQTVLFLCISLGMHAQYNDYIGAGHSDGVVVSSSSVYYNAQSNSTIDGSGMYADEMEAARFLWQATMGADMEDVDQVTEMGFEAWIDWQMSLPRTEYLSRMEELWSFIYNAYIDMGYTDDDIYGPWAVHFNYTWWENFMNNDDQLRQKVAYSLSQILVISMQSDIIDWGEGLSAYYDILMKHSFGNYKDLLTDVTLNPCMGYYLTHLNNPKEVIAENIHPDENYARELMQLFTIGLYELNLDGTRKLDAAGNPIPTYNNNDIKQLARVFTGLGPGAIRDWVDWVDEPYFGLDLYASDRTVPMIMYPEYHEEGTKELINGYTIIAGQPAMKDINDAIDHLFNHPNVGPFIGKQMIQRLVKSNPSPAYVERVATVFNNDGNGERGNMAAVIKAILLDDEARSCESILDPAGGKMREPFLRYTQMIKSTPFDNPSGNYWNNAFNFEEATGQIPLGAPTVFNFYLPDYQPVGELTESGLVAPEFSLHNTRTAIGYVNLAHIWMIWRAPWWSWNEDIGDIAPRVDYESFPYGFRETETMLNHYDILYTGGQMTDELKDNIREQINPLMWDNDAESWMYRHMLAAYFVLISPDFVIHK